MTTVRRHADADRAWLLALNNASLPAVSPLNAASLDDLLAETDVALVAEADGAAVGALIALARGRRYASLNYRWFEERLRAFLYVDRIIVAETARSAGIGARLYEHLFAIAAREGFASVCCEVNLEPPNPRSLEFHRRLGFVEIAARLNEADGKTVAMLVRPLDRGR